MRRLILSSLVLALAACSPPASQSGGTEATNDASNSTPGGAPGQLRVGRWTQALTVMGQQSTSVECVTTSDLDRLAHDPSSNCTSANGFQATPAGLVYEAECTTEEGAGHVRTVLTGDLQTHYVAEMTYSRTAGGAGPEAMQIRVEGTYDGACRGDE